MSFQVNDTEGRWVPMLGSIKFLRNAGAIIDSATNEAEFRNLASGKIIQLQTTTTGLQVLDAVGDLVNGQTAPTSPSHASDGLRQFERAREHGE